MQPEDWFLTPQERPPSSDLDGRHPEGKSWTIGNSIRPLVHGAVYFAELLERVRAMGTGDLALLFPSCGISLGSGQVYSSPALR